MLIPIGTDRGTRRTPVVTGTLVALTVFAYAAMYVLEQSNPETYRRLLHTFWVVGGSGFRWWQPITSTFLHAGLIHLIGNMVFLWVFGPPVEDRYGRVGFLILYVLGAYAAGGLHAAFERQAIHPGDVRLDPAAIRAYAEAQGLTLEQAHQIIVAAMQGVPKWIYTPAVGASGAIAAVTGAFLVLFPRTQVRSLWLLGLGVVNVPAWWIIGLAIAFNLLSHTLGIDRGIAYLAHLGGYTLGFGLSVVLLAVRVFPREPYDLLTIFKQAQRRRQFRAATASGVTRPEKAAAHKDDATARAIDDLAERRALVSTLLHEDDEEGAANAYRELVRDYAHKRGATTLSRSAQYRLAAYLFAQGRHEEAAGAFEHFLEAYPADREADAIRVLLARILGEHLGRAGEAREILSGVIANSGDPGAKDLARQELEALSPGENAVVEDEGDER